MTILDQASQFVNSGIAVIPIRYKDKRPEFSLLPKTLDGKASWEPFKTTLPDTEQIRQWFVVPRNYGVVCGWNNLVVLDFDQIQEYNKWLLWTAKSGGLTCYVGEYAFRVATARGVHVYIRLPHKEKNRKLPGIDIKGDGYVLGPGSVHPSGAVYTPMRDVLNIPLVSALSDVLPVDLLIHTEQSAPAAAWTPRAAPPAPGVTLIEKIRKSFQIEDFFPGLKGTGKDWFITLCPLHDDHNPSFWVNAQKQVCGCFAGCNDKPMDVVNLYARLHGLSNREAIFALAGKM